MQIKTTIYYLTRSEWWSLRIPQITNVAEDVEKRKSLNIVSGNVNWCRHYGKQCRGSSKNWKQGVPVVVRWLRNPTRKHEVVGLIPGLAQWVKDPALLWAVVVGHRHCSDLALLWLWCRLAAVAPIGSLAWEPPYAVESGPRKGKKTKKNKKQQKQNKPENRITIWSGYVPLKSH